jgi:2-polyprenyl-3-methyl-5-hydroxy-6-metoxy-1,4-benzoquinol methylase
MLDVPRSEFWHLGYYTYPFYRSTVQNLFEIHLQKSFQVLDAGCGPDGGYITTISTRIQGIGLDISHSNIRKSVKTSKNSDRVICNFLVGDLGKIPFHENCFDIIICQDVLEHLKDKQNAIREMALSLKRGGKLIISTTNAFNPAMFVDDILPNSISSMLIYLLGGPRHYERNRRLNPLSLRKMFVKNGLRLKELLMIGYPPIGKPWIYQYSKRNPPKILYFWIFFNELTNTGLLKNLKEVIVAAAEKTC